MHFTTLFLIVYLATTAVALVMTYREQKRREQITPMFTLIGYVLCLIWPVVAAVMVVSYRRMARQHAAYSSVK